MKKVRILLLAVIPALSFSQLQVKNYFSVTGKKDVAANVIAQDATGFLLLGTAEGAFRFDGRVAEPLPSADQRLKRDITAIHVGADGRVWLGSRNGKVYMLDGSRVDSIDFRKFPNEERITSICRLDSGICIGTYGNGIYGYSGERLIHFTADRGLSDNVVYRVVPWGGRLWCATDAGISRITDLFTEPDVGIISNRIGLPDNIVRDIFPAGDRLLIAMQDSGLCYFNPGTNAIEKETFFTSWTLGPVVNATQSNDGRLVVATEKNGLLVFDRGNIEIYSYADHALGQVNMMMTDRASQVWLASRRGISQFSEKRYNFINMRRGLMDEKVLALARDNDNAIWIGTASGIARLMSDEQGKIVVRPWKNPGRYTISCASRNSAGDIWFGTYGNGIVVHHGADDPYFINSRNSGLSNDNISSIYFESDSVVYVSTLGGGLNRLSVTQAPAGIKARTTAVYTERDGLGSDYVYAAMTDTRSVLYAATDGGGLQRLTGGKFSSVIGGQGLKSTSCYSICRDSLNRIWAITSDDGIIMLSGSGIERFDRRRGIRDEQPQQLLASGSAVFAIHAKGIDKISCRDLGVSHYDVFDGDLEPNLNAVCFSGNRIYSGTNNGILVFRTSLESLDSVKPSVYIRSLLLAYKPFPLDSVREFRHNENSLSFVFGGIWLKDPEKLQYRYRLEGLEEDWLWSNEGKQVNYNNLGPGTYTFAVQARNEEQVWSDRAVFSFVILTPVWQRWWFWPVVVILAGIAFYLVVKYRLRALRHENLLLEKRVKERTAEIERQSRVIELKNLELERLSLVASKTDNVVLILDPGGKPEYVNDSFRKHHDVPREGDTIYELSSHPNIRELVNEAVSNRRSVSYESFAKNGSGKPSWQSSTLTPIFDEDGTLKKIIIIDTDVTERKKQEQIIVQKNKDITDSISYARKIQHAILPDLRLIRKHLPSSFILYLTKDIVSGDFYWYTYINGSSIIAAVDCTGHGVPGAFMSLIGYNLLNRIVKEKKITGPSEILFELNKGVVSALNKDESDSKDGMDIAVCRIDHSTSAVHYAGAMRPLWIVRNGSIEEIRPDKIPIGTKQSDRRAEIAYVTHSIAAQPGDRFYIFTDGYADQFGGDKDKKYSSSRFRDLLRGLGATPVPAQEAMLREEHVRWKGDNEQIDDILVIGFGIEHA